MNINLRLVSLEHLKIRFVPQHALEDSQTTADSMIFSIYHKFVISMLNVAETLTLDHKSLHYYGVFQARVLKLMTN